MIKILLSLLIFFLLGCVETSSLKPNSSTLTPYSLESLAYQHTQKGL